MAPFDRRTQRSLPFGQVDGTARQQWQRLVEALQQGDGRQELRPRRSQLDREREVVQAPADRCDRLVGSEVAPGGGCAAHEELDGGFVRQRLDGQLSLGAQVKRCP